MTDNDQQIAGIDPRLLDRDSAAIALAATDDPWDRSFDQLSAVALNGRVNEETGARTHEPNGFDLEVPLDRVTRFATPRQTSYLKSLVAKHDYEDAAPGLRSLCEAIADGSLDRLNEDGDQHLAISIGDASRTIDALKHLPFAENGDRPKVTEGLDLTVLPSGRYAVPGGETRLKLKIDVVEDGKWAGWVFVKDAAVYGQGQRYGSQRPGERYQGKVVDALTTILEDPRAAMVAYGRLTNTCGNCGRALEDEESVRSGIGPVCAGRLGWG